MEYEQALQKAGLTGNEAIVYLQLLKNGEQSANEIAKRISMDRTLAYTVINHLIEKGMANYIIKSNKKFFKASNPEHLLNPIKEKEAIVKDLIENLKSIKTEEKTEQEINIYEGKEAIRKMYMLIRNHKDMVSFGATGRAYDYLYEAPALAKEIMKNGLKGRIITSPKFKDHPMTKIRDLEIRYLDIDSEATTTIFGNYVLIHMSKHKPYGIFIRNKEIAETYRKYFEVLWKSAKD